MKRPCAHTHTHTSDLLSGEPLVNQWDILENVFCFLMEQVPFLSFTES